MPIDAKYVHTNLIAKDWHRLSAFYQTVFGCIPVPPERDLSGPNLESTTGAPGAHIRGLHLRPPACDDTGPTLEIFQYYPQGPAHARTANTHGFGHIAFVVPDVPAARDAVL